MRLTKILLLALLIAGISTFVYSQGEATQAVDSDEVVTEVVEPKMVFEAQTLKGDTVNLADQIGQGKWTLVMFWQVECSVCRQQEPIISEFHEKYSEKNAEVIGISIDGMERIDDVKDFLGSRDLSYPNFVGDLGMMAFNYQAITEVPFRGTPTYLLFSPEGELLGDNPGPVRMEALENFIASRS